MSNEGKPEIMKCGACGCDTARLEALNASPLDGLKQLDIICTQCGGRTIIKPMALMAKEWGEESPGTFCTGWERR